MHRVIYDKLKDVALAKVQNKRPEEIRSSARKIA